MFTVRANTRTAALPTDPLQLFISVCSHPSVFYSSLCSHQLCHEWFSFTHWTSPFSCLPRIYSDYVWVIMSSADRTCMLRHLSLRYKMKVYSHTHTQLVVTARCLPSKLSFWTLVCHRLHWTEPFFSQNGSMRSGSEARFKTAVFPVCVCVWHDDGWQASEWWCVIYINALWLCVCVCGMSPAGGKHRETRLTHSLCLSFCFTCCFRP